MLAVSVEFLHGTFRGDPDGTAKTAGLLRGEWPPTPFRLFAALVAADGTRDQCRVSTGDELTWFERLPPPTIRAAAEPWHQVLRPRYVVKHKGSAARKTHQEYVAREGAPVRPGCRVSLRHSLVVYSWDTTPPSPILDALRRRAARVGYLGCADSPVRVRIVTEEPEPQPGDRVFAPVTGAEGDLAINVPAPGTCRGSIRCSTCGGCTVPTSVAGIFRACATKLRIASSSQGHSATRVGSSPGCSSDHRCPVAA